MRLSKLATTLPNGFHDAVLDSISINYCERIAKLSMRLWIGLLEPQRPAGGRAPVLRRGVLHLTELDYCAIEPPEQVVDDSDGVSVSGDDEPDVSGAELPRVDESSFVYGFYATDWNTFIYVAARDASINWQETEEEAWRRAKEEDGDD